MSELTDYIQQCKDRGMSDDQIKQSLIASGWAESDIDEALGGVTSAPEPESGSHLEMREKHEVKFSKMYMIPVILIVIFIVAAVAFKPGGGGAKKSCVEDWTCTEWSDCINGLHERTCTDQKSCNRFLMKPRETESCTVAAPEPVNLTEPVNQTNQTTQSNSTQTL